MSRKVSARTAASTILGPEVVGCVQNGSGRKVSAIQLATFCSGTNVVTLDRFGTTDLTTTTTGVIDQIGATPTTLIIDRSVTATVTKADPTTLNIIVVAGGSISISTGVTLTINGCFSAPSQQKVFVYSGTGIVKFGIGATREIYPQWWDELAGIYTHDCTTAMQAAIVAAKDLYRSGFPGGFSASIYLAAGIYKITSTLTLYPGVVLIGAGIRSTSIYTLSDITMMKAYGSDGVGGFTFGIRLQAFGMQKQNAGTVGKYYVDIDHAFDITFDGTDFYGTLGDGVRVVDSNTVNFTNSAEIDGISDGSNVGTGLIVLRSNVFGQNPVIQGFFKCFSVTSNSGILACVMFHGLYIETIEDTIGTFDNAFGSVITGLAGKSSGGALIGFNFTNGSHDNLIIGGFNAPTTYTGLFPPYKTDATSYKNRVICVSTSTAAGGTLPDAGIVIDEALPTAVQNNSAFTTVDLLRAKYYLVTATNNSAISFPAPINMSSDGTLLYITIKNTCGGTMGAISMDAAYHSPATVESRKPANGFNRTFIFMWNTAAAVWYEISGSTTDIAN